MNIASIWHLPVIYACENNQYGEYTAMQSVTAGEITQRGQALAIPSRVVDGMDVLAVYEATNEAVHLARRGGGPSFLVFTTYRYGGHGMSDRDRPYRSREEEKQWREQRDPIDRFEKYLTETGQCTTTDLEAIRAKVKALVASGVEFGNKASYPDSDEVTKHVYSD
jgi:pyruvate dehydrogenase E1 component alpha subunit